MQIKNIAIIGAGNMGHQIALCAALSGFAVRCTDTNSDILNKAIKFADNYLQERVNKSKLTIETANQARENIVFAPSVKWGG
jgi:3-hydroxybutyryl-CoA dehydrogenase